MTVIDHRSQPKLSAPAIGTNYFKAPPGERLDWQKNGLCRTGEYDPEIWMPEGRTMERDAEVAKDICYDCPVMLECGKWALDTHEVHGVWGGYSESDRDMIWRGRRRKRRFHANLA